jgi:CheY-like chemotaxis protein
MNILFCDDENLLCTCAREIFLNTEHDFLYTQTIEQSKLAIKTMAFDVIIIDILWHGVDQGFRLVDFINEQYRHSDMNRPLVYVTSAAIRNFDKQLDQYKQSLDGAYQKPEELIELLKSLAK